MRSATHDDLTRMRRELLFDGPEARRKLSRFWILLTLAAVIATAGVVADSTATVIGAMIVAPLMLPILGTVLSITTDDLANLARSVGLMVGGALAVVAIGFLIGLSVPVDTVAETSSQVAGRIQPRLIDLLAAVATGLVGSIALARSDISDTLPGVAIAISLVPPLAVVGLTLEAGAGDQAVGALLLFLTNVGAILLSGLAVMSLYRVHLLSRGDGRRGRRRASVVLVVGYVILLAIPLAAGSSALQREVFTARDVRDVASTWAAPAGWTVDRVDPSPGGVLVETSGPPPGPAVASLRARLAAAGLDDVDIRLTMTPRARVELTAR